MADSFVHLHSHSEFSLLDGAAKIDALCAEAARLGMPALAITDHGNLHGAYELWKAAGTHGITPIQGIEAYISPGSRHHKKPVFWGQAHQRSSDEHGEGGDVSGGGAYTHMTMLAENPTGVRNLFTLSSLASFEGHYRKARMDRELISQHAEGIIATTGCPSGEVQTRLRLGQHAEAMQAAADYRDIFGPDNFYLELMDHGLPIERSVREDLLNIGRVLDLKPLATNDSHYVTQDQAKAHDALLCVQTSRQLSDTNRFRFEGDGYYLKSPAEMRAYWDSEVPGATDNTLAVAARIESYDEVFTEADRLPRFPVPAGTTEQEWLRSEVHAGLVRRFPDGVTPEYAQRADYELDIIISKGFSGYFLVVADVVRWAKERGIRTGPGRGSAAGSLVVYALGITELDPIRHRLLFERFLNPQRPSMPDIDLDFDDRRRGEVIQYVTQRWGEDNVAQIATFGTIKTKAAFKDAARVLYGQPGFSIADRISKALPAAVFAQDIPLSGIFDPSHERYGEATEIRDLYESDPKVAEIMDTARGLEGLVRNVGVHASAVILSAQPLLDVVPLWKRDDGSIVTQWEMYACEAVGLLKMDFLGLRSLTILNDAIAGIARNHQTPPELDTLELDDPAVYDLLSRGDTLGVFQLDGRAMRDLLIRMKPSRFEDISAALALYRPGPMAANAHLDYADRAAGRRTVQPIHPELAEPLADILDETYGLIVYQEQVLAIAQRVAGYSLGSADLLRKAMGKKKRDVLDRERGTFEAGMVKAGYSLDCVAALWDILIPFSNYVFNKSHTTAYGLLSYWAAHLKAHHPAEYMAAVLTGAGDKKDRIAVYLAECRRMGIKVLPPDVNESGLHFTATGSDIRFGLGAVRNVGEQVIRSMIRARGQRGRFASFEDFLAKIDPMCCNKRMIESLIKAGAFDSLGHTRQALASVSSMAVDAAIDRKKHDALGQSSLFDSPDALTTPTSLTLGVEEWPQSELLAHEREMLGLFVSAHPLDDAETLLRRHACPITTILDEAPKNSRITVAGMITKVTRQVTKQGKAWATVTVEDLHASIDVQFFGVAYAASQNKLAQGAIVVIKGRVNHRDDTMSIAGSEVIPLNLTAACAAPLITLRADATQLDREVVTRLRGVLLAHQGDASVRILMRYRGEDITLAVDDYRVTASSVLVAELSNVAGITTDEYS